ncbi:MAG: calcium/sodium antiporter [Sedimentisphaerales bacterium]|nr:calcium/sodium antiporter [Sedimentisphaerales bacterium]
MDLALHLTYLAAGLVILWKCAELLVAGAVGLARRLGISPLIIGLTVVAMGTSAPEAAASIAGVLQGTGGGDLAVGNVFGSNIANLALVGGLIAIIRPLVVRKKTLMREVPAMLLVALLLWPMMRNACLSRIESVALLAVFAGLIIITIRIARREGPDAGIEVPQADPGSAPQTLPRSIILAAIGLVGLAGGAKITVEGAVFIGRAIGISEGVIALTVIAFGTSLPELVTCVVATLKGQHDISVGNLVGSNIFNTLLVTGAAGAVRPFTVDRRFAGGADYWIMIGVSAAFAILAVAGRKTIGRIAGAVLVAAYVAYIVYLFTCTA